jgi:hypothetical protein
MALDSGLVHSIRVAASPFDLPGPGPAGATVLLVAATIACGAGTVGVWRRRRAGALPPWLLTVNVLAVYLFVWATALKPVRWLLIPAVLAGAVCGVLEFRFLRRHSDQAPDRRG